MEPSVFVELIRDVGVPGAVLVLLLLRLEPKLDQQTRALDRLTDAVQAHAGFPLPPRTSRRPGGYEE